jgi:uncharacterized protein
LTISILTCYNIPIFPTIISHSREKHLDKNKNILRLNVGFLLKENIGYSREITFDEPEVHVAADLTVSRLSGAVSFTRTPQGLYAQGRLQAVIHEQCVRCLVDVDQTLTSKIGDLFIYPPENAPEDALTVGEDVHINLAPLVRENMLLSKPMRILCRPDCKGLCPNCGQNWNEGPCDCHEEPTDPRWGALGKLKQGSSPEE